MANQTVVGLFNSATEAQQAVQQLVSAGFVRDNVDLAAQSAGTNMASGLGRTGGADRDPSDYRNSSGTATEAVADGAGRAGDSISSFFSSLFGNDNEDTMRYTEVARRGGSVVTVHAASNEEARRAADIMDRSGAMDVNQQAEALGYSSQSASGQSWTGQTGQTSQTLPIIEENLQVGKRVEETGGARIRSRIIERPVEESVRLREEHVNVERRDVNRPATEADFTAFKEGEIEVREQAERAVVAKEARVVGEVSIGKEVTEREETVRDTVRRTDVDVERLSGDTRTSGTNTSGTSMDNDTSR